jgi:hypothetical protein
MTAVAPVAVASPGPILVAPPPAALPSAIPGLPSPLLAGLEPNDALAQMLLAIQRSGETSAQMTETEIQSARTAVQQQLDKYLEQLRQAIEAAEKAKEEHDDGGFFGSIVNAVADVVGTVLGTVLDFQWDAFTLPFKAVADIATHLDDPASMLRSMQSDALALGQNGDVANSVHGFSTGVIKFAADFSAWSAKLTAALASGATGNGVWDAIKDQTRQLWTSLKSNILDNPQFWEVVSTVGKAAAVAGAVASGGALAWVAVGLIAVSELDKQTGIIEKTVGRDAAPWVRLGIGIATTVLAGFDTGSGSDLASAIKTVQGATAMVQGVGAVVQGVRTIRDANDRADEIDRQANLQATLNRMQQLNRLVSDLLDILGAKKDDQKTEQELGSDLVQTQSAMQDAAIMPA